MYEGYEQSPFQFFLNVSRSCSSLEGGEKAPGAAGGGPTSTGVLSPEIETIKEAPSSTEIFKKCYKILQQCPLSQGGGNGFLITLCTVNYQDLDCIFYLEV